MMKRIVALFLCFACVVMILPIAIADETDGVVKIGDVNMDNRIDAKDALCVLKYIVGKMDLNERQLLAADPSYHHYKTEDHLGVDAKDALIILQFSSSSGPFKVKL